MDDELACWHWPCTNTARATRTHACGTLPIVQDGGERIDDLRVILGRAAEVRASLMAARLACSAAGTFAGTTGR
jgi:hypothetical protein